MKAETLFESLDKDLFRPVMEGAVHTINPVTGEMDMIKDKKALMYEDTGEVLAVVGHKYRVIQNSEVYLPFCQAIVESNIDLTDMEIRSSFGANGRSLTSFIFPAHKIEVRPGDKTLERIVARNSYDGTWKFSVDMGGFRIACANGQVAGKFNNAYSNRHTSGFNIAVMSSHLSHQAEGFAKLGDWWMHLQKLDLEFDKGVDYICEYLYNKPKSPEEKKKMMESGRASAFNKLLQSYDDYIEEVGSNVYALYNTLTDHASHSSPLPEHQFDRQKRLIQVIDNVASAA